MHRGNGGTKKKESEREEGSESEEGFFGSFDKTDAARGELSRW